MKVVVGQGPLRQGLKSSCYSFCASHSEEWLLTTSNCAVIRLEWRDTGPHFMETETSKNPHLNYSTFLEHFHH